MFLAEMRFRHRTFFLIHILFAAALLAGCSDPLPLRIGFIGDLSGRHANLGEGGRNGLLLAAEEWNAAGGIHGRRIEVLVRDDAQDGEKAAAAAKELVAAGVHAIIGPMTSSMVLATLPAIEGTSIPLISPTATSTALEGKDDAVFRILSSDPEYAAQLARYVFNVLSIRQVAIAFEENNAAYAESLATAFSGAFATLGGRVVIAEAFNARSEINISAYVNRLLNNKPQAVFIIANTVDAARLAQTLRARSPRLQILGDTVDERLLQIGGRTMEGYIATQAFDRDDTRPRYLSFKNKYETRHKQKVGFSAVTGYDAGQVVFEALSRRQGKETLKEAILRLQKFAGLQEDILFDRFGDTRRKAVVVGVRNGAFVVLE